MKTRLLAFLAAVCLNAFAAADPAASGDPGLKEQYARLRPQLEKSAFGRPLHLEAGESSGKMTGEVYAVLDHPFKQVSDNLAQSAQWCEVLTLPFNVQGCESDAGSLKLLIGRKPQSPIEEATRIDFRYSAPARSADALEVKLSAPSGPAGTRDYLITFSATPLDDKRTFVRLHYGYSLGAMSRLAMKSYLSSSGADKVGFTSENGKLVGGMRGIMERNTMRYFLAIEAYLDALAQPEAQRKRARLEKWFAATERYAKQLREMSRDEYLALKEGKGGAKEKTAAK
jgi:hypothetical protein